MLKKMGCISFRLKPAGLIIGWISMMIFAGAVVMLSSLLFDADEIQNYHLRGVSDATLFLMLHLLSAIASVMLIWGIARSRNLLILPWLFHMGIWLIILAKMYVSQIIEDSEANTLSFVGVLVSTIGVAIVVGAFVVVYAVYKEIGREMADTQKLVYSCKNNTLTTFTNPAFTTELPKQIESS